MQLMQTNERLFISCKGFESDDVKSMHRKKNNSEISIIHERKNLSHDLWASNKNGFILIILQIFLFDD